MTTKITCNQIKQACKNLGIVYAEDRLYSQLSLRGQWQDTWVLRLTSVVLNPLLCIPVEVSLGDSTIYFLVKKKFSLSPKEHRSIKNTGKKLVFGHRSFGGKMSQIVLNRIKSGECIQSLMIDPIMGHHVVASRDFPKLRQAWGAALTVHTGILTYCKRTPVHSATLRKNGKTVVMRASRAFPLLSLWTHFLRHLPAGDELKMVKVLKLSLCGTFALKAEQELPEGYTSLSIPLMPIFMQQWVESKCNSLQDYVALYFSLQQAKSLLARVPDTFILEGLKKHKKGICRPIEETIPKDAELYDAMKKFSSSRFGAFVGQDYKPYSTVVPPQTACIEASRQKGGNLSALKANGSFINTSDPYFQSPSGRMEPIVVGLFGAPGSGKSTRIRELTSYLNQRLFPSVESDDLVYSRSCASAHWDGYSNQPIVVLDDFGQDHERSDVVEFAQLVSTNQYILPMAELSEKGRSFTSPIIIVTSNLRYGDKLTTNGKTFCEDPAAIWRRFTLSYATSSSSLNESKIHRIKLQSIYTGFSDPRIGKVSQVVETRACRYAERSLPYRGQKEVKNFLPTTDLSYEVLGDNLQFDEIKKDVIDTFQHHITYHRDNCQGKWVQSVHSVDLRTVKRDSEMEGTLLLGTPGIVNNGTGFAPGLHSYIQFPLEPPPQSPVVEVVALPEPAKVRCITVGECDLKVLKPLQVAMWQSLKQFPEFSLTHGVGDGRKDDEKLLMMRRIEDEINRIGGDPNGIWLSGDYTAATDNLPMWVTEALLEGILEHIEHEPTKKWARYEAGAHDVLYPGFSNIEPGRQTSGQLMGSLLSFPLLCMANAFIVEYSGIKPGTYLVNGDDIVANTQLESIDSWKVNAPRIGLSLSMGKNFISESFCTVNSQLFLSDPTEPGKMCIKHTGKTSLIKREFGASLGRTYSDFQDYYGCEEIFNTVYIRHNLEALKHTPKSLQVPLSHGGLGSTFSYGKEVNQKLAKEVWITALNQRIVQPSDAEFNSLTGWTPLRVPYLSLDAVDKTTTSNERVVQEVKALFLPKEDLEPDGTIKCDDMSHRDLSRVRDQLSTDGSYLAPLRFIVEMTELKISDLPSLGNVKFMTHFVRKSDFSTLRHLYLKRFAHELRNQVKYGEVGTSLKPVLDLGSYVEAFTAKTLRRMDAPTEPLPSSTTKAEDWDNIQSQEDDIFMSELFNATLLQSEEDLVSDNTPISKTDLFLSYDRAIVGHSNEQGSKGIPGLVFPVEVALSNNPWA